MSIGDFDDRQSTPGSSGSGLFPCTLLQERLWTQLRTDGPGGLNIAMRWLVNGSLSQAAAESALQSVVQRHEILRTGFCEVDGKLAQIVLPECPLKLRDIDLSVLPANERAARAEEIARTEALEPIDPGQAPLLRTTLLRLGADRAVLLLTFHAMVADGWSTGLIARELRAAASAIGSGAAPDTSEPELQFVDYALWQQALLESGTLDEAQSFWQRQLRDAVGTEVPPDRPPPAPEGKREGAPSHIMSVLLPDDLSRTIEGFARQQNVTLYTVAVAGLALMLHRVTGDTEIVVGSQVANREEPTAEKLVGPTVNAITLRLRVGDNAGAPAFVSSVADTVYEALRHQRLPFEIARKFAPDHDGKPLHAINLVVHRSYSGTAETEAKDAGRFSLVSLPSYSSGPSWPLNFFMIGRDEGWRLSCEADASLYEPATVQGLVESWRRCLEVLATTADIAPALDDSEAIPLRDPARHVVRFHERGAQTPVTVLNNRSVYYQLARVLGEERPFIDIMLYPPDGPFDWSSHTFEDFGTYAMRLIRWAQPRGPYILGGHCVFGVLAFEAARQLQRLGETVALVALFDSWAPGYRETMSPRDQKLRKRQLRMNTYAERLGQYRRGEIGLNEIARKPILRRLGLLGPDPEPETLPGQWFDDHLREAAARYRPSPYGGNVVIFRSEETLRGRLFDEQMGWGPLVAGDLKKVEVGSAHLEMFREQPAGEIAAVLRTR
ncbi:MAG: condensation domain-containing protein [Reyranella sp.]